MLTRVVVGERIRAIRLSKGLSQEVFGLPVGLSRSALSQIESGSTYPSLETLANIVKHYSTSWEALLGNTGSKSLESYDKKLTTQTIITTVDNSGKDNIVLVPVKAQAGYLVGSQQTEYIEHLPTFWLPGLSNGTFRAFEVSGYSMLADRIGFFPGDVVIAQHVENLRDIKDGRVYVLVNDGQETDNIILKRCLNYIDKGDVIICKSDNKDPQYPTFPLPVQHIKEVWEFKIKITRQASEPSGLFERMNALEGEVVLLKEKLKKG